MSTTSFLKVNRSSVLAPWVNILCLSLEYSKLWEVHVKQGSWKLLICRREEMSDFIRKFSSCASLCECGEKQWLLHSVDNGHQSQEACVLVCLHVWIDTENRSVVWLYGSWFKFWHFHEWVGYFFTHGKLHG